MGRPQGLLQGHPQDGGKYNCQCAVDQADRHNQGQQTAVQALNALCMLSRSFEIICLSSNEEHFIYNMCTDRHTVI